ncbi:MAG TPA: WecB/TagA/CpsF family glycosyltransferase [Clostridia bacterium]|nr:WecB/TagA/CpsF family glycosyltransferase [Clostridia bacterium]
MRITIEILGIPVDSITMTEAVEKVGTFISDGGIHTIFTPNAEIMMAAHRNPELASILTGADMLTADGAGVVLASKILNKALPEKVSGFDLVKKVFETYSKDGIRCFLFGSKPGVSEAAAERIRNDYPGVIVAGCRNGYFTDEDDADIVNTINSANADILLVALGAPKQEMWINSHLGRLNCKVCIGVGGTIDVFSGNTKLAPDFFRRNGLEWLYRLCKEPKRAKRMLDLPRFVTRVVWSRLTGK